MLVASGAIAVRGTVVDSARAPIASAIVSLQGPRHVSGATNSHGEFTIRLIPGDAGVYRVVVTKPGYAAAVLAALRVDPHTGADAGTIVLQRSAAALPVIGSVVARERLPFNATPASIKVFPREAYRDQAQAAVSTVLSQTPGAFVARDGASNAGQAAAPYAATVRGGLPFETAILVDGIRVSLPSTQTFNLAYIPSFVLQDVEIARGPGGAQTAIPNAIDGTINFRTADPTAVRKGMLEVDADSRGGQFSDFAYDGTAPGGRFSYATMLAVDGNPGPQTPISAAGEALQRAELLKASYNLSPASSLTGTFLGSQGTLGLGLTRGFTTSGGFASLANAPNAQETHRWDFGDLDFESDLRRDHLGVRLFATQLQRTDGYDAFAFPAYGSGLNAADASAGYSLSDDHRIGSDVYELQFMQRYSSAAATACTPGFGCVAAIPQGARENETTLRAAALLKPAERMEIQLAAAGAWLRDRYSTDGGLHFNERTFAGTILHAGASYKVRPNVSLRVAAGTGFASPPLAALNGNAAAVSIQTPVGLGLRFVSQRPAPLLSPETSYGFDTGAEYRLHGGTAVLSADAYHTRTNGAFVDGSYAAPLAIYQWFGAGAMTHEGVEVALSQFKRVGLGYIVQGALTRTYLDGTSPQLYRLQFGPGVFAGNLAMLSGQNLSGGSLIAPGLNDVSPLRVPYAQGYAEISYKWPRGSRLSLGALYYGANNPFVRPAFLQFNSNLELSLGNESKFQLSVQNLTNVNSAALPVFSNGIGIPLAQGAAFPALANVVGPRTIRFIFRQSVGGSIFEH